MLYKASAYLKRCLNKLIFTNQNINHNRSKKRQLNQLEKKFQNKLYIDFLEGKNQGFMYEPIKISLAHRCTYCPDFLVLNMQEKFEIYEVKGGFIREDSIIKLKISASDFPNISFFLCKLKGNWEIERVKTIKK